VALRSNQDFMPPGKRLHISPLNSQLLPIILPRPLLEKASNISFHSIQTFPENPYGYLELPDMEADKLRKKLNGTTLKGSKMRIEEARPKKRTNANDTQVGEPEKAEMRTKEKKKKGREEGVLPGYELHDRKVKRGWTEPSSESKPSKRLREKSDTKATTNSTADTGDDECLFKTTLPPNVATSGEPKAGKVRKRKRGESTHGVVVHEFANTTKHASFLRDEPSAKGKQAAVEFVDGKGWVDIDGHILEAPSDRAKAKSKASKMRLEIRKAEQPRSRRSSRLEAPSVQITSPIKPEPHIPIADDETSSSGTSSSDNGDESASSRNSPEIPKKAQTIRAKRVKSGLGISGDDGVEIDRVERLSITRSSATPPPQEPPPTSAPSTNEVHPLEALFKRPKTAASHTPKKPNLEVSTSFKFFDPDAEEGESQGLLIPQTPFTQQDIRQRRQRSAAPTPDTAAPGKTFGSIWEGTSDISESEDDMEAIATSGSKEKSRTPEIKEEKPESEFSKWFWEHRGENNRAWKRRRREAAKEKRQRENRERKG